MSKLEYELLKTEEIKPDKCPKCKNKTVTCKGLNNVFGTWYTGYECFDIECGYKWDEEPTTEQKKAFNQEE